MKLDEKLVSLRKEKKLTQMKVAEELDVSRQAVSRWEAGIVVPSTDNLKSLSKLYGVPIDYLIHEESERPECAEEKNCVEKKVRKSISWFVFIITVIFVVVICGIIVAQREQREVNFNEIESENWSHISTSTIPIQW